MVASSDKRAASLRPPVPLEILSFAPQTTLAAVGHTQALPETPPGPDGIADHLGPLATYGSSPQWLDQVPGVIEHGLLPRETVDPPHPGREREVVQFQLKSPSRPAYQRAPTPSLS